MSVFLLTAYQFLISRDSKSGGRLRPPLWCLFAFHYFLNIPIRSLHFFFLITNQKSEKPPSPATATVPIAIAAIAPPDSPSLGSSASHSSQMRSSFASKCSAGVLASAQTLQAPSQSLSYLCPSASTASVFVCSPLCVQVNVLTPFSVQVACFVITPSSQA